jgi:CHAD domain-containing protein
LTEEERNLKSYVNRQTSTLLRRLTMRMRDAEKKGTEESIHDLRTSIRRLNECLRTFELFFPGGEAGRLRRKLSKMMKLAGEVRNRDVASELFAKGNPEPTGDILAKLAEERHQAKLAMTKKLKVLSANDFPRKCRRELHL